MKKKILFVTLYLQTGGVEKSLLSLLSNMDYDKYDVDLLLFDYSGVLMGMIPERVNLLPPVFESFSIPLKKAAPGLIKSGKYRLLAGKFLAGSLSKFSKGVGTGIRWSVYRHTLNKVNRHYDVAISYLDLFCNYYVTEKVSADKKIVYNHMDYLDSQRSGWPSKKWDRRCFSKSNYIVSVADSSRKSLEFFYPEYKGKIRVIQNTISPDTVHKLSNDPKIRDDMQSNKEFKIVTVARLVEEKGIFTALEATQTLIQEGYNIKWFVIGNGPLRQEIEVRIKQKDLASHFLLLGERENPYPYMRYCDLYIQPSKTEAHCVAVEEAISLCKPILVTDIPAFRLQIRNQETGIIVNANTEGIVEGIKKMYHSEELRDSLSVRLKNNSSDRAKMELSKFFGLLEA
ncbi:MAG: glycosyltransferase [Heyndrickxia sp.]